MLDNSHHRQRGQGIIRQGLSVAEAAKMLQVDHSTLYLAMQKGQIAMHRTNGRTVISHGALQDYRARKRPMRFYWD